MHSTAKGGHPGPECDPEAASFPFEIPLVDNLEQ